MNEGIVPTRAGAAAGRWRGQSPPRSRGDPGHILTEGENRLSSAAVQQKALLRLEIL